IRNTAGMLRVRSFAETQYNDITFLRSAYGVADVDDLIDVRRIRIRSAVRSTHDPRTRHILEFSVTDLRFDRFLDRWFVLRIKSGLRSLPDIRPSVVE